MLWVLQTFALFVLELIMPRVSVDGVATAFLAAAVIGLLNAFLWPILTRILLTFAVLTLGFVSLLLNGLMVVLASRLVPGFEVETFWSAVLLAFAMTVLTTILSALFTIDDDYPFSRNQLRRRVNRTTHVTQSDSPGFVFLEIDGLAAPILEQAISTGHMPVLKSWLDSGTHKITPWETDTSSQTSASQAGILHGSNGDIPAFRWYDKANRRIVTSSNTRQLPEMEAAHSDGNGLLADDGASRGNLLSGDAKYVMNTASVLRDRSRFHASEFVPYFANAYNASRTFMSFVWDVVLERYQFFRAHITRSEPRLGRHQRGGFYPLVRATMTVLMRDLNIHTILGDMFAGRKAVYATFVGYDEIAHHSGILDGGAFDVLHKLDRNFGRLAMALPETPRPYHLIVLSDHGQTGGATFKQRYGKSLEQLVQELMTFEYDVGTAQDAGEALGTLNAFLTDALQHEATGVLNVMRRVFKNKSLEEDVLAPPENRYQDVDGDGKADFPPVVALASGNLGLVSFTHNSERLTMEEINASHPAVIPGLAGHKGIAFAMVRSREDGAVVLSEEGTYYLEDDRVIGKNPLDGFGPHAADHLRRTDSFSNCPDILVNSFYDPATNEGCAFEELIGFHGGLGGTQTEAFLMHPVHLPIDDKLIGAESIYRTCKRWIAESGPQTAGGDRS